MARYRRKDRAIGIGAWVQALFLIGWLAPTLVAQNARLLEYKKVWDRAPHNEFTDLVRFNDIWVLTFREADHHTSKDGKIRILLSKDCTTWRSAALLAYEGHDLRDPKLEITPDGRLMLNTVVWLRPAENGKTHQSLVYFSADGPRWEGPHPIGEPNVWIWRTTWHKGVCYGVGYHKLFRHDYKKKPTFTRLYRSTDGLKWKVLVPQMIQGQTFPNEGALAFGPDDTCYCLLRCTDYAKPHAIEPAQLGIAKPPYTTWRWIDLGVGVGGPELICLPDGRLIAACRMYTRKVHTGVCWVDLEKERLVELVELPSSWFNGYPGVVAQGNTLVVSNHASHEGEPAKHPAIYIGKIAMD